MGNDQAVGCGDREADSHPNGSYVSGRFSGILAGWADVGIGLMGNDQAVGCGDREADSHPNGSYVSGRFSGILAGRADVSIRLA